MARKEGPDHESLCWYDDQISSFIPDFESPRRISNHQSYINAPYMNPHFLNSCKQELHQLHYNIVPHEHQPFIHQSSSLPQLESPKLPHSTSTSALSACSSMQQQTNQIHMINSSSSPSLLYCNDPSVADQVTDWRVLDKFVASQLMSHEDNGDGKETDAYSSPPAASLRASSSNLDLLNWSESS